MAKPQAEWGVQNTHATPTPIIEEGRIYAHFGSYGTAALDTETGEKLWERRDLNCDHRVRPASSPIIDGDSLFLNYDGVDAQFVAALDKRTGATLWLQNRAVESDFVAKLKAQGVKDVDKVLKRKPSDNRKSYATSAIIEHEGRRQLISPGAEVTFSYDPETGEELWRVVHEGWGWNVACRPIYQDGLVYLTQGNSRRLVAVRPSGSGDVTATHIAWSTTRGAPEISSPLIVDDLVFMVSDGGVMTSQDAKSGEEVWKARFSGAGSSKAATYWASPVHADGKIYLTGIGGTVTVVSAAREFELLAENEFDARFTAGPAIAGDAILLRSGTHLYRVSR